MVMANSPFIFKRAGGRDEITLVPPGATADVARGRLARPRWRLAMRWAALASGVARPCPAALTATRRDDGAEGSAASADNSASAALQADTRHGVGDAPVGPATAPSPLSADYEAFIRQHERAILNYLWRMTGDEQAAYDLTQEVFLRAWQRFDAVRRYDQPRSWLFRVATNLAITYIRRRALPVGAATTLDSLRDTGRDPAASDPAGRLAESDLVRRTLLQLSPQRRAALVLREVYGLSAAEVGRALGMTAVAVRMALHRGRQQFRALYLREGGDPFSGRTTRSSQKAQVSGASAAEDATDDDTTNTDAEPRAAAPDATTEGDGANVH